MRVRLSDLVLGLAALAGGAVAGGWAASSALGPSSAVQAAEPAPSSPGASAPAGHDHAAHAASPSPKASPAAPKDKAARTLYACPMHPEVTSERKEDRCSKCGMFLEPVARK